MASLYDRGWRQGSLLTATLPFDSVILGVKGEPERDPQEHERWVVATQDCDLFHTEEYATLPTIELRPAFASEPPPDYGIRSAKLWLNESEYLHATSPRAMVSAAVLSAVLARGGRDAPVIPDRQRALRTWLGLRYDRPAVPERLGELASRIATEVQRNRHRQVGRKVRDILMRFDETATPPRYSLYAVLEDAVDRDEIRGWLSSISQDVPTELGVGQAFDAQPASKISLELVETSYSANLSQLTWRPNNPNPEGAGP